MTARRVRVEFIRFGLLLTLTVGLLSVAARHGDHDNARGQAARGPHHSSTASPSTGASSSPASPGRSSPGSSGSSSASGSGAGNGSGEATGGSGANGAGQGASAGQNSGVATLPRTGPAQAAKLAGLAALFIVLGSFSVRVSRRPAAVTQTGDASTARAQPGHAFTSSESNLPGTG